jgi:integrase/recombinase XerD
VWKGCKQHEDHQGIAVKLEISIVMVHGNLKRINVFLESRKIPVGIRNPCEVMEALDRYIQEDRTRKPGPLFASRSGARLQRQNVDDALKEIAAQANAGLPAEQQIHLSAHLLRHTFLRKVARKHGVEYAKELAGHTSERYIWRYVQPSEEEKEAALEDLF